jgi:NADH:ubiquinone oxidoreductase subunit 6 (subunit J)
MLVTLIMVAQNRKPLYIFSIIVYCLSIAVLIVKSILFLQFMEIKETLTEENVIQYLRNGWKLLIFEMVYILVLVLL